MHETVIGLSGISKGYNLYRNKQDRMKEALHPRRKKYHKEFYALKNIDLDVKKGEVIGIVGRNGCGKSTLLKIISKVLTPTSGTVHTRGNIVALLELGAGFNPEFTGMENIYFYCSLLGYRRHETDKIIDEIITFAEIGDFIHQPVKTYSSGMKARLSFAVSVNVDPDILILDEVLSVGDALFRRKCFARMEEFFKGGKTILYVSHSANTVNQLCTRAILLDKGEIILDGPAKQVTMYYEKMLFAKSSNVQKVRQEILDVNKTTAVGNKPESKMGKDAKQDQNSQPFKKAPAKIETSSAESNKKAYYIEELQPKSTMEYKQYDVDIYDIKLTTPEGDKVNALITGDEYIYEYKVKFNFEVGNVIFGMMIKTEKGVQLSASSSRYFEQIIEKVETGSQYWIQWKFICNLLQGNYYTNAGVASLETGERTVLNRIVDALFFKVQSPISMKWGGMVYMNQDFNIYEI